MLESFQEDDICNGHVCRLCQPWPLFIERPESPFTIKRLEVSHHFIGRFATLLPALPLLTSCSREISKTQNGPHGRVDGASSRSGVCLDFCFEIPDAVEGMTLHPTIWFHVLNYTPRARKTSSYMGIFCMKAASHRVHFLHERCPSSSSQSHPTNPGRVDICVGLYSVGSLPKPAHILLLAFTQESNAVHP